MQRETMSDLVAFLAVARERSFTRAAAKLGVSPSALSHTIRKLEERLGVRLLTRTSRSVATTEPGERLLERVGPHFDQVADELDGLMDLRDTPSGTLRITTGDQPAESILMPAVTKLLRLYPDLTIELIIDNGFVDIVNERFDAGVRLGETLAQDMIAVRIGPDLRMAVAASPDYLDTYGQPIDDLAREFCEFWTSSCAEHNDPRGHRQRIFKPVSHLETDGLDPISLPNLCGHVSRNSDEMCDLTVRCFHRAHGDVPPT